MMIVADFENGNADAVEDAVIAAWELQSGKWATPPRSSAVPDSFERWALLGRGAPLADALENLERGAQTLPMAVNPATASLYAVNPLPRVGVATLFMTHPPIEERVTARARARRPRRCPRSRHDRTRSV